MIIWVASYPKSGNTWLRALLTSYYYTNTGLFNFDLLKKIEQFPEKKFFTHFAKEFKTPISTASFWIAAQNKINEKKKINFFKTHNSFCTLNGNSFTNKRNTAGCIYIVRDPRNVLTSIKHHYEMNYQESLKFMLNEKKYTYDLPNSLQKKLWKGKYKGQEQRWFLLRFIGEDKEIDIQTKKPEFKKWKWIQQENLIDIIIPFKKKLYKNILKEFKNELI